jgi:hypothetical protein
VKDQAEVELSGGVPFISDDDLREALDAAGVSEDVYEPVLDAYGEARLDGLRQALAILGILAILGLLLSGTIPRSQPTGGAAPPPPG